VASLALVRGGILTEPTCEPRSEMRAVHFRAEDDLYDEEG
jgi:hypothetical protein